MWLTSLSIRRPLLILMVVLAIMLGGAVAYQSMAVDLLPSVKFPYVGVVVAYPGAGPREVETRITKPVENAVAGAPGIKNIYSTSGDGYSSVVLEFKDGTDPDIAAQDVERRINQIRASLPENALDPTISKYNPEDSPIIVTGVSWDRNPDAVYNLVDETIRPRLEAIEGIAAVNVMGGRQREIQVTVDRQKLEARGLSITQVTSALAASNLSAPAGYVQQGSREYNLRVYGLAQEIDHLANLVLASSPNGAVVRLKDVANVQDGFKKQGFISRANGVEGVALLIMKQQTANTVRVTDEVRKTFKEMRTTLPAGVEIMTVMENARFVKDSLEGVEHSLRDAVIIVAIVLLLFLHTWRSTLIVLISIPTSLIATFGVMWAMGFSLNMMSMMGLALTIGILVDDSIVILENIHRHMKLGESPFAAAFNGREEIGGAAVAITLVDVVVYTPLAFLTGMVGQFFKEFGGSIVVATLFSLLVSFTLTPMLASRWLAADAEERSPLAPLWRRWEAGFAALERNYRRLLGNALRLRWLVLLIGFLAFVSGIALVAMGAVGSEFITQSDEGMFTVTVDMPAGTALATTNRAVEQLEREIASYPETDAFLTLVGIGGQHGRSQARSAKIYVNLKPLAQRKKSVDQIADQVRLAGRAIPGMTVRVAPAGFMGSGEQAIQISVKGSDMAVLSQIASRVEEITRKIPGTLDVTNSAVAGSPEMRIQLNQEKLSDLGLTSAQIAGVLRTAFEGTVATELRRENEDKVDIRVKYSSVGNQAELSSIPDIPITTPRGTVVKLGQVAELVPIEGPAEIERENRTRQVLVSSSINGRPLGDVTADLRKAVKELSVPAGYKVVMRGESEMQDESFSSLGSALLISIVLMYMLMVALYNSLVYPLVIMGALPVASVGAIGALALTGDTLNIFSLIGFIMLTGLVAKNAILLVDYTNTLRDRGYSRLEALLEAGPIRLRPIVMTTAAMVFAMFPMALKLGEGSATRSPMAIVVIGGLITSTLLTLVVVPAGYTVMDDLQRWVAARFGRRADPAIVDTLPETAENRELRLPELAKPRGAVQAEAVRVRAE